MASKALIRLLLILALIFAAHAIKPLSSGNLAAQLEGVAGSISMILPDSTANTLSQANYLVSAVGRSLTATTLFNATDGVFFAAKANIAAPIVAKKAKPAGRETRSLAATAKANAKPRVQPVVLPAIFPTDRVLAMSYSLVQAAYVPVNSMKRYRMPRTNIRPVRLVLPASSNKNTCEPAPVEKGRETISTEELAPMIEAELLNDQIPMALFNFEGAAWDTPDDSSSPVLIPPIVQECENEPKTFPLIPMTPMY